MATDKSNYEYVTVPERDGIREWPHPGVRIGMKHYGPGKHLVDPISAETIRTKVDAYQRMLINTIHTKAPQMARSTDRT